MPVASGLAPVPDGVNQPEPMPMPEPMPEPIGEEPALVPPSGSDGLTAPEPVAPELTIPAEVPPLPKNATPAQQETWFNQWFSPGAAPAADAVPAAGAAPAPATRGWLWGGRRRRVPTPNELALIKKMGGLPNLPLGGRRRNKKTSKKGGSRKHKKTAKKGGRRHKKTAKK